MEKNVKLKLFLNKEVITKLNDDQLLFLIGGVTAEEAVTQQSCYNNSCDSTAQGSCYALSCHDCS